MMDRAHSDHRRPDRRQQTPRAQRVGRVLLCAVSLTAACSTGSSSDAADAAPRRKRDGGTSPAMSCIRCSMLAQLLTSGGGPPGGMDPCAGGMTGGGMTGGFTFCSEAVFSAFTVCMQARCAASCPLGPGMGTGGMMCPPDGGSVPPADAGAGDAGLVPDAGGSDAGAAADGGSAVSCASCLTSRCAAEYAQCEADR